MAYDTRELRLHGDRLVANGMQIWTYDDTAAAATVIAAGYISDAMKSLDNSSGRGMQVGDFVYYRQFTELVNKTTLTAMTLHSVTAVISTGATLSATF